MYNDKFILNLDSSTLINTHVTLDEVKSNLHIDTSEIDDDARITRLIKAASEDARNYCDHYFSLTELAYIGFNFSVDALYKMRVSPFSSLESFETSDDGITWTEIKAAINIEKRDSDFTFHFDGGLTATYIRFTIRVGYIADQIPENAKDAIVVKASDKFDTESSSYAQKMVNLRAYENSLAPFFNARWL